MKRFTPEEDKIIKELYLTEVLQSMADILDRPLGSVVGRMKLLGLKVPAEIIKKRLSTGSKNGIQHRYEKGHIPVNKGKKWNEYMSKEAQTKSLQTAFKTGLVPATTKYFGEPYLHTRKRKNGYFERLWYIQPMGGGRRQSYLHYLCEQRGINMTGKKARLKEGYNIEKCPSFEDITIISNEKNMQLNSVHRLPKEIQPIIQLKRVLTREINKQKNEK